jgi:hypothetical protein
MDDDGTRVYNADARDLSLAGLEQCLDKMATVVEASR